MLLQRHWRLTSRATRWCLTSALLGWKEHSALNPHQGWDQARCREDICALPMCADRPRGSPDSLCLPQTHRGSTYTSVVSARAWGHDTASLWPVTRAASQNKAPQPLETPQRGALNSATLVSSNPPSLLRRPRLQSWRRLPAAWRISDLPHWNPRLTLFAPAPNLCHFISPLFLHGSQGPLASPALPRSTLCFVGLFMFRWIPPTLETWPKFCLLQEAFPAYLIPFPSPLASNIAVFTGHWALAQNCVANSKLSLGSLFHL